MARPINMPGYLLWPLSIVSVVLALLLLVLGGGMWWLSTASGRDYIGAIIHAELSGAIGYQVQIQSLRIRFPLTAEMSGLSLADGEGVWLQGKNVSIHLLPAPDILNHIVIRKFEADALSLLRTPESPAASGGAGGGGISISVLGVDIKQALAASKLTGLPQDVIGAVSGSLGLAASTGEVSFQMNAHITQGLPELETGDFSAAGLYRIDQNRADFEMLRFSHPKMLINGSGAINMESQAIWAELQGDNLKLEHWIKGASGNANIKASISGTFESPAIDAAIRTQDTVYNKIIIPSASTSTKMAWRKNTWLGSIHIDAASNGEARADYSLAGPALALKDIAVDYLKSEITGNLQIDLASLLADGELQAKIPAIQQFSGLLPEPVNGAAKITAVLSSGADKQAAVLAFDLQNIMIRGAEISAANAEIVFSSLASAQPDSVRARLAGAKYAGIKVNEAVLEASREGQAWKASLISDGSADKPFNAGISGELRVTPENSAAARLTSFSGAYGKIPFSSAAPVTLLLGKEQQEVTAPALKIGSGRLALKATLRNNALTATATGNNFLVSEIGPNLPLEIRDGRLAFSLMMAGALDAPRLELDAYLTDARLFDVPLESKITASAKLQNGKADISITADDASALRSGINARLPLNFSLYPFIISLEENSPVAGDAAIALNISALSALLLPPEHAAKGAISARLTLSGTVSDPAISGQIKIVNGAYNFLPLGVSLQKISATIVADNQSFTLTEFHAEDANANQLTLAGRADFTSGGQYAYDLRAGAKRLALVNHPVAHSVISGDLTVQGDARAGAIAGQIKSESLDIFLPDRFSASVPELNITGVIPGAAKPARPQTSAPAHENPILLDVTLLADNKVFVRGWGLDAELKGQLHLTGNILEPAISGKFSTIRGSYEEFGKRFKLQRAELVFEGDIPPSPYLNVVAATTESGVEIRPVITGPAGLPVLKIESTPAMPQEEALSVLLFGKNSAGISPVQAAQLANSLRRLSGKGGRGFDPTGAMRNLLGVDAFSINGGGQNGAGASVGIGKYISDGIYLEVQSGMQTANDKARVEVQIAPNITVESSTGATGDNSAGVNWKLDY